MDECQGRPLWLPIKDPPVPDVPIQDPPRPLDRPTQKRARTEKCVPNYKKKSKMRALYRLGRYGLSVMRSVLSQGLWMRCNREPEDSVVSTATRRTQMSYGSDRWRVGEQMAADGSHRSARSMRFYALSKMLEAAEIAARTGATDEATEHIRELQAHCERMVALLNPEKKEGGRLRMVAA